MKNKTILKVATLYAVIGWLLIQFADISLEAFESPPWIMQAILMVILAGLPIMLAITWALQRGSYSDTQTIAAMTCIVLAGILSSGVYLYFPFSLPVEDSTVDPRGNQSQREVRDKNPVLAILPFSNMSPDSNNEYLADGITEDIITLLAQSPGLDVIARNSTFKYKNTNPDIRDVGKDLHADYIVEGSIRPLGTRIRVTVQVIDALTGTHIWAEKYDRDLSEFFAVQDEVSFGIAAATGDAVFRQEYKQINQSRTANMSAWALTSKAVIEFNTLAKPSNAIDDLTRAIELDPDYALAYAVLARAYGLRGIYWNDDKADVEKAQVAARKALSLAPNDPKVLALSAMTILWCGLTAEALPMAKKAVEISPGYVEGNAYYGDILIHNGMPQEGIVFIDKAIQLTPHAPESSLYQILKGEAHIHLGNFENARESFTKSNRLTPNSLALVYLAGIELLLGNRDIARTKLMEGIAMNPESTIDRYMSIFYTFEIDDGGPNYQRFWKGLLELEQEISI